MTRRAVSLLFLLPLLVATGCGPGDALECGEGTERRNGTCVAIVDPISSCGDGTLFDDATGKCEPTVRCGEGTVVDEASGECVSVAECGPGTELDLASGECVPSASCGPGTVLDDGTGECVAEAACGPGTVLDGGECVAVGTCGPGSVLNMDTGLCESSTQCGPGQVIAAGQCVSPNGAVGLEADARESTPEHNDPLFGGTPEPLTLEAVGEKTVFVGNISRPAALGGGSALVQDRDVWGFTGSAGQYLDITVLGTGLPHPAFILEGPKGYRRTSPLLSTNDPSRQVVLPYDGAYELVVVPSAYISTGLPLGSTNAGYVGVIERRATPAATTVVPAADQTSPVEVTGNLRDLSDNFFLLDGDVGDALSLVFADASAANPPAILAFDASGDLLTHVDLDLAEGAWVGTLVKDEPGTTIVVDWQSSTSSDDAYTLRVAKAPHVQGGTASAGSSGGTASTAILGQTLAAFTITLPSSLVFFWDIDDTYRPDLQIQSAEGTYAIIHDEDDSFFYGEPGSYTFFVFNDDNSEDDAASLVFSTVTPVDLGTLDPVTLGSASTSGHLLTTDFVGPDQRAWMVVRTAEDALLSFETTVEAGDPELVLFDRSGKEVHGYDRARTQPVHVQRLAGDPVVVMLDPDDVPTLEWSVTATATPVPDFIDVEPNDVSSTAVPLGPLPAVGLGHLKEDERDRYTFTLPAPLEAGQSVEVLVENLDAGVSSFVNALEVFLFDELDQPLPSIDRYFPDSNISQIIAAGETQSSSTFHIEVLDSSLGDEAHTYLLRVRVIDTPMEVEPNDTRQNADVATSLPATWYGYRATDDAADYFSFTLPSSLAPGQALRVRYDNMGSSSNSVDLYFEDPFGNVVAQLTDVHPQLAAYGVPAGAYFVRLEGPGFAHSYRLTIEVIDDLPLEVEPNDGAASATPLGVLPNAGFLWAAGGSFVGDADWFSFTLPSTLGSAEGIQLRALNLADNTALRMQLYDLADTGNPVLLGEISDDTAVLRSSPASAGPFGVRVITSSTSTAAGVMDPYYLRVEYGRSVEREPNDSFVEAHYLGELRAGEVLYEQGNVSESDDDWFTFTLHSAYPADNGVWVSFRNFSNSDELLVSLYDASDPGNLVLLSQEADDPGVLVTGQSGVTLYALHVIGTDDPPELYEVFVEAGPDAELEPNDDELSATPLGALPKSLYGIVSDQATDVFRFTLASNLASDRAVEVYFDNLSNGFSYDVRLRSVDASTDIVAFDDDEATVQSPAGLAAGDYTITVDGLDYSTNPLEADLYQLDVRVVDAAAAP